MNFSEITFAAFDSSMLLVAIWLLSLATLLCALMRTRSAVTQLASNNRIKHLLLRYRFSIVLIKTVLALLGCTALLIALLRPQCGKREHTVKQEGRDLFVALDISRSMLAQDCPPNRLSCAKEKIRQLVRSLSCERVGLIVFSGSTFIQCPLTTDYDAFLMYLDGIDVETISSGTTALDQPILKALDAFKHQKERKNKLLVIFTDGEDFSTNLTTISGRAAQEHMTIFAVGVGTTQGAPIPLFNSQGTLTGHQLDRNGSVVISRLNETLLSSLAKECGGLYIPLDKDSHDVKKLVAAVEQYEKYALDDVTYARYEERYNYAVFISFVALIIEWLL